MKSIPVKFEEYLQMVEPQDIVILKRSEIVNRNQGMIRLSGKDVETDIYITDPVWELLGQAMYDIDKYDDNVLNKTQCHIFLHKLQLQRANINEMYLSSKEFTSKHQLKLLAVTTMITSLIAWLIPNSVINDGITIYGA